MLKFGSNDNSENDEDSDNYFDDADENENRLDN